MKTTRLHFLSGLTLAGLALAAAATIATAQVITTPHAVRGAAVAIGPNAAAVGQRGAVADGQGNAAAGRRSAFTTANGSTGQRSGYVQRSADGSASAERQTTATNANTGVTFDGNTIPEARLETQIQSKAGIGWYLFGGKVDRSKIDADKEKLTAYYRSLGYFRARISAWPDIDDSGKWVTLRFVIDEGPRYKVRSVAVEGNKKFAAAPLLNFLAVKSGNYFNQAEMNKDLNTITDLYGSQGHVFADVQADPRFLEEPGQLDLVYRIKEGDVFKVSEVNVHVAGEFPHTRNTVVLTRLSLLPGDIINSVKVHESERRLKAAQVFETNPAEGDAPRIVIKPPDAMSLGPTVRGQEPDAPSRTPPYVPAPPQPPSLYQPR